MSLIDSCVSSMGSRGLRSWLLSPRRQRDEAHQRHEAIAWLRTGPQALVRERLKGSADIERITARVALRQVRPRELVALRQSLSLVGTLQQGLEQGQRPALIEGMMAALVPPQACMQLLERTLLDEPSVQIRDGGVIREGTTASSTNCGL